MSAVPPDRLECNPAPRVFFDVVLMPHRSLSPAGFCLLMALLSAVSFVAGMFFVLHGAWPVTGYFGLDVLLVYLAFKANYRSARLYETVKLTEEALVVERVGPTGKPSRWSFQPYWLRVELDEPPRQDSQLRLSSHGRSLAVGGFLSPEERAELAEALRDALRHYREAAQEASWAGEPEASRAR